MASKRQPSSRTASPKGQKQPSQGSLLPVPTRLERICKGLAALDATMTEEWDERYYSFNAQWDSARKQRLASMRNGSGDEWFIVFSPPGAFFKAFFHEYPVENREKIYAGLSAAMSALLEEPSLTTSDVTFGGFFDGTAWTLRGNATPMAEELLMLNGNSDAYQKYASEYFGNDLPLDAIEHVLLGKPLDTKLLKRLTSERTLVELREDLAEIGYHAE